MMVVVCVLVTGALSLLVVVCVCCDVIVSLVFALPKMSLERTVYVILRLAVLTDSIFIADKAKQEEDPFLIL